MAAGAPRSRRNIIQVDDLRRSGKQLQDIQPEYAPAFAIKYLDQIDPGSVLSPVEFDYISATDLEPSGLRQAGA
jgi:hypothetical protein